MVVAHCPPVVELKLYRPDVKYNLGFCVKNGLVCVCVFVFSCGVCVCVCVCVCLCFPVVCVCVCVCVCICSLKFSSSYIFSVSLYCTLKIYELVTWS